LFQAPTEKSLKMSSKIKQASAKSYNGKMVIHKLWSSTGSQPLSYEHWMPGECVCKLHEESDSCQDGSRVYTLVQRACNRNYARAMITLPDCLTKKYTCQASTSCMTRDGPHVFRCLKPSYRNLYMTRIITILDFLSSNISRYPWLRMRT